jgi:hypothetical protein
MYDPKFPEINLYNPPWKRPFKVLNLLYYIPRKQKEYTHNKFSMAATAAMMMAFHQHSTTSGETIRVRGNVSLLSHYNG